MAYRVLYSRTSRNQIKALHPQVTPVAKKYVERLKENPFLGKSLEKELSGYYSLRSKRFRIIYTGDHDSHIVQAHYVGHRRDVYELFRELLDIKKEV